MISLNGNLKCFIVLIFLIVAFIFTWEWNMSLIGKFKSLEKVQKFVHSDFNAENDQEQNGNFYATTQSDLSRELDSFFDNTYQGSDNWASIETTISPIAAKVVPPAPAAVKVVPPAPITVNVVPPAPITVKVIPLPPITVKVVPPPPITVKVVPPPPITVKVVPPPLITVKVVPPAPITVKVAPVVPITTKKVIPPAPITTKKPTTAPPTTTKLQPTTLNPERQTGLHLIKMHCDDYVDLNEARKHDLGKCPKTGIVSAPQGGRLGNQIFEYAGVFVHAKIKGLAGYVGPCFRKRLDNLFANLSLPTLDTIANCPFPQSKIRYVESWKNTNQSLFLYYYYQDLSVLMPHIKDLLQEFQIRADLIAKADVVLRNAKNKVYPKESNVTFVGVHVRRTDYAHHLKVLRDSTLCNASYFFDAMNYYEKKYKNVMFIYASDNPTWCKDNFGKKTNVEVVSGRTTVEEDMSILARCNHSIIDYGTYGIWSALLAGGETIVKKMRDDEPSGQMPKYFSTWRAM